MTLLAAMALLLCIRPGLSQTLKVATLAPDGTVWMNEMRDGANSIEERTEGRVHFKFYPGGVMGNDKSVIRKMRIGQLQGGAIASGALANIYPDSQTYGLPMLFRSYDEVDYVRSRVDETVMKGLEVRGYIAFGIVENGFAYLMSNRPISRVNDLKRLKVWVPEGDPISRTFFEAAGHAPIPLPLSDVLTGLQTGLIETVGTPPIGAIALQWHTAVKYLTDVPLIYTYGTLVIERHSFNRLKPKDQTVVMEVLGQKVIALNNRTRKDNEEAREALSNHGITFVKPSPEELRKLRAVAEEANRRLQEKNIYSLEMLSRLQELLGDYRQNQKAQIHGK